MIEVGGQVWNLDLVPPLVFLDRGRDLEKWRGTPHSGAAALIQSPYHLKQAIFFLLLGDMIFVRHYRFPSKHGSREVHSDRCLSS